MRFDRKIIPIALMVMVFVLPHRGIAASDGATVFDDSCSGCHNKSSRPLDKVKLSREQWKKEIDRMSGFGAEVPEGKKLEQLLDYLVHISAPAGREPGTVNK